MSAADNFPRVNVPRRQRRRCVHKGLKNEQGRDASAALTRPLHSSDRVTVTRHQLNSNKSRRL